MTNEEQEQVFENTNNDTTGVTDLYKGWFLDYASYVILERAVPAVEDGLKPVQRRILHAMKEMDDGRFNKVANIVGQSMQYHPHGDASITDAIVNMGQKDLLIETQGNWGDFRTGDDAAAPRYIEARLSKLALEIAFNNKTTDWALSYDGRKKEPVTLPMKFPLVLAHGAEGIAVGLSTKVMPHNFIELCIASVNYLRGKKFELFPDFLTEGMVDCTNYNDGKRGGKIRVRSRIEELDKKTLLIKDVPYSVTVSSLCDSITKASEQGKIKIKKVTDVTAAEVAVHVELAPGISPDITIDALYAFTDCEVSISPNVCVIQDEKPVFTTVSDLLRRSTDHTKDLLQKELEIKLAELNDKWHYTSLEKIFFEEKIYKELEKKYDTWELVIEAIDKAFNPFKKRLKRDITREDILKLTEKPVRRIYKLDIDELNAQIKGIETDITNVEYDLANLVEFTIKYFQNLQSKFGKGRERKTEVRAFDVIEARTVAIANTKVYVNRADGFIGSSLKKDELIAECSTLDDIIAFTKTGTMKIVRVAEKAFIGKDIIYAAVFQKNDERTTYNMAYADGKTGISYVKRFNVHGITRDKEYDMTSGSEKSKILYLTPNPNGEAETVRVILSPNSTARTKEFDWSFEELEIKSRGSKGNQLSKYPVKQVKFKEAGRSTLAGRKLWYDEQFGRLSIEERSQYVGMFDGDDFIIAFYKNGTYEITGQELTQRFDTDALLSIERYDPEKIVTAVYYDHDKLQYNIKRFRIESTNLNTPYTIIREGAENYLELVTTDPSPVIKLTTGKKPDTKEQLMKVIQFVDVTGWRTIGTRLVDKKNVKMEWIVKEKKKEDDGQTQLF